jgi:hypothetical protein
MCVVQPAPSYFRSPVSENKRFEKLLLLSGTGSLFVISIERVKKFFKNGSGLELGKTLGARGTGFSLNLQCECLAQSGGKVPKNKGKTFAILFHFLKVRPDSFPPRPLPWWSLRSFCLCDFLFLVNSSRKS